MVDVTDKIHTAYHEAGHWIAADELDVPTDGISILSKDDGTAGRVHVEGGDGFFLTPGSDPYSPENERLFQEYATTQAIIDYAGHAAVVSLLGIGDMSDECALESGAGSDFEKARERLGGDDLLMSQAKDRAIQIVTSRRDDAELIVDKLLRLGELDSQQVDILLGGAWDIYLNEDGTRRE